jgi:hypothetical protein
MKHGHFPESEWGYLASTALEGSARDWFSEEQRDGIFREDFSFDFFSMEIEKRYNDEFLNIAALHDLLSLKCKNHHDSETWDAVINSSLAKCRVDKEHLRIALYMRSLPNDIGYDVIGRAPLSMTEATRAAKQSVHHRGHRFDHSRGIYHSKSSSSSGSWQGKRTYDKISGYKKPADNSRATDDKPPFPCKFCGGEHWNKQCPSRPKSQRVNHIGVEEENRDISLNENEAEVR